MINKLFVYGTLAPGQPNEHYLTPLKGTWQIATVRGTLHPEGWGATWGYPAVILDDEGDEVPGALLASDDLKEHWEILDEFEGEAYKRVIAPIKLPDGSSTEAYAYVLNL